MAYDWGQRQINRWAEQLKPAEPSCFRAVYCPLPLQPDDFKQAKFSTLGWANRS